MKELRTRNSRPVARQRADAHDGADPELQLGPEPDVEQHQADRETQGQDAALEELARDLGTHDVGALEGDGPEGLDQSRLDLVDRNGGLETVGGLEADHGGGGLAKGLDLDVAEVLRLQGGARQA